MNIIYIHGLDSNANSTKGALLESYCQKNNLDISVHRPDLNQPPEQVFNYLLDLVTELSKGAKTVLIGSSLGGYFSTLVSNHTGCSALLLNPSTQPHITLQRFSSESNESNGSKLDDTATDNELAKQQVLYRTSGGWAITTADLQWFEAHQLSTVNYPNKVSVLIKENDELLNPELSKTFYQKQGVTVTLQAGGDHRFSDFSEQLPLVISMLRQLV